jgi:phospholipid/cholesterol/gamma-HCH transport system substrate-binding protein
MTRQVKAGIFVVVIGIALILTHLWMSQFRFKKEGYPAIAHFPDVTGLKVNDAVRVYGVEKGSVQKIEFTKDYVKVNLWVEQDVTLYTDTHASIKDVAMISGTKFVDLSPGKSGIPLPKDSYIPGKASFGIPLGDMAEDFNKLVNYVSNEELMNRAKLTLSSVSKVSQNLEKITGENRENIKTTIKSIKDEIKKVDSLIIKLGRVTAIADTLLRAIQNGEGTIGRLTKDDSLYQETRDVLRATKELVEDIKENPKRYIKIF